MPTETQAIVPNVPGATRYTPAESNNAGGVSKASHELGKDAFMKLLVTQLKNQDPLNPQDNQAFLAQLAQFSSLEQMKNLNDTLTKQSEITHLGAMSNMVGKSVTTNATDAAGNPISGVISSIVLNKDKVNVVIGANTVDLAQVVGIDDPSTPLAGNKALPVKEAAVPAAPAAATTMPTAANVGQSESSQAANSNAASNIDMSSLTKALGNEGSYRPSSF